MVKLKFPPESVVDETLNALPSETVTPASGKPEGSAICPAMVNCPPCATTTLAPPTTMVAERGGPALEGAATGRVPHKEQGTPARR